MSAITTGLALESTTVARSKNIGSLSQVSEQKTAINTYGDVFTVPDYTFKQVLDAIPKHCFQKSLPYSLHFVARDILAMAAIGWVGTTYIPLVQSQALRFVLYSLQSFGIGLFGFGLWILAHECGHGAFSNYPRVNDFVGWVLHSYCGVPYFSWKFSHAKHHQHTGNLQKDTVFIPWKKAELLEQSEHDDIFEIVHDTPIYSIIKLIGQQLGGLQLYLATNATGQPHPGWSKLGKSHYNPNSPVFDPEHYWYILLSDLGLGLVATGVYFWYKQFGLLNMAVNWFVPWLWVNHWLVFVTFLQHTDPTLPHYDDSEWNFAKGAAATIDREFGFIGQHIFHDIIETHVLHHYVSRVPFYHARDATDAIKKVLGKHYRHSDENMWKSLWKCLRSCQFVDGSNGVYMYRNTNGIGVGA
ncbi:hypothetical protein KL933_000806 [Ogataea haglerorum]|uniref:Fatty acid desaturase domain-containing protein n=1 Tax=Ogataea haglerorum TaxID=1937702 RepID=A0AAN6I1N2_9ASCO|nr:uncharacterized protein KL911_004925 [Ogataea haglerorum]KAG7692321.1 hypothetical protein KL915_004752 [Ogataea haglerorum]KAG7703122.1 hypothetical protein KL914_004903 [Ogataea haglerorum]KAG7703245.1 hypothetical protein KL950_004879 [Ogataea haglerorum]KAG7726671.1 hypothetical protein KL948_004653 [Ogataea haglerorum]KAG7729726.1 hypothetical protein KL933_000806 [Ogataea haglerorum]